MLLHGLLFALCAVACERDDRPREQPTPAVAPEPTATTPVQVAVATLAAGARAEELPRTVGAIALRMSRDVVETHVGSLACHDNPEGFKVCRPADPGRAEPALDIFFVHERVVSLAHEIPAPPNAWTHLESLTKRFGTPALSGFTERDRQGQLHEIYGWKDERTLYSIRFIWHEEPAHARRLAGAAITLWDREAYAAWESDRRHTPAPTPPVI